MSEPTVPLKYLVAGALLFLCLVAGAWWLDVQTDLHQQNESRYLRGAYSVQPSNIEDWMTFNYLDQIFALPPSYLENALQIQDAHYPNISIKHYSELHNLDEATFLAQVRAALVVRAATSTP